MRLLLLLAGALLAVSAHAQNIVVNGSFTKTKPVDNLWDGINFTNGFGGFARAAYAVTENGPPGSVAMPLTVSCIDMNGDGKLDIATCDPLGVMRVYFNSGTKTEPKFTIAEIMPIFLARAARDEEEDYWWNHGLPKMALYDPRKTGTPDLYVGNYAGEIMYLRNSGTPSSPVYAQPPVYSKAVIPTGKKNELWGNLFAPCIFDWNKDGKPDILVGEGSYSANAVHLLLNESSNSEPKFTEETRYYLCYGDGREHLQPTVADYNGDGLPDVLVGNRQGTVAVHLQKPGWKPGTELLFSKNIDFGGAEKLGAAVAPYAADLNGDGLFDLIIGRSDQRVQVAYNTGTPTEPKFGKPVDLQGTDLWPKNINQPEGWTVNGGETRGNFYGYVSVTDEKSPGGGGVVKMSYWPSPNKIIKMVPHVVKGEDDKDFFRSYPQGWLPMNADVGNSRKPTNCFCIRQTLKGLKNGAGYTLNFKSKGAKVQSAMATVALLGIGEAGPAKVERKARGVNITKNEKKEENDIEQGFSGSAGWSPHSKQFTITWKEKEVRALPEPTLAVLEFKCYLSPFDGDLEICDVEIVPSK